MINTKFEEGACTLSPHATCKLGCLVAKPSPFTDVRFVSCMHRSINVKIEEPYWRRRPGTVTTSLSNSHSSQRDNKYSWVGPAWIPQTSTLQAGMHAKLKSPTSKFQVGGLQLYRHACLKCWSPPTSSTRLGGFRLAWPSCMYTNQVHISVMAC